jgi:HSP20 family molecular chaperone IbpA
MKIAATLLIFSLSVLMVLGGTDALRLSTAFQPSVCLRAPISMALSPRDKADPMTESLKRRIGLYNENSAKRVTGAINFRFIPTFDLKENLDGYVIACATPGLKREDLQAEVVEGHHGPVLIVRGESKEEEGTLPDKSLSFRATCHKFEQRISLPVDVDQVRQKSPRCSSHTHLQGLLACTPPSYYPHCIRGAHAALGLLPSCLCLPQA